MMGNPFRKKTIKSFEDLREYYKNAKSRKRRRLAKRQSLLRSGQLSSLGWTYWRDKADHTWSLLIQLLAKLSGQKECPTCDQEPKNKPTVACHKLSRRFYATRFLLENGYWGCDPCNFSEKMNRGPYWDQKFAKIFGEAHMEHLRFTALNGQSKFDVGQMRAIYEDLRNRCEKISLVGGGR